MRALQKPGIVPTMRVSDVVEEHFQQVNPMTVSAFTAAMSSSLISMNRMEQRLRDRAMEIAKLQEAIPSQAHMRRTLSEVWQLNAKAIERTQNAIVASSLDVMA